MAYITGSANNYTELRQALFDGCTANGWTLTSDVLHKGQSAVQLIVESTNLKMIGGNGQSGGALLEPCGGDVRLGGTQPTFPATYFLFIHTDPDEVYFVVNFDIDWYQQFSFGISNVLGSNNWPWFTGQYNGRMNMRNRGMNILSNMGGFYCSSSQDKANNGLGLFIHMDYDNTVDTSTSHIYTNIDPANPGWHSGRSSPLGSTDKYKTNNYGSASLVGSLLWSLPSTFNGSNVLLPIKSMLRANDSSYPLLVTVANLAHARFTRIDNNAPQEIIQYGNDKWMLFPWAKKDTVNRNGNNKSGHLDANDDPSGTLAYAIRYDGP